ncbi:hypothetical protein KGF56_004801 [Candida oxycetoniae]|uniref:Zn(2)-C6 fungal-type domain-containing protein n=1 Tax=Candida oxycetoniae TaxID=497107 RepID=A0AAI9WVH9_9ASCO|nr:uncharacterized protein KGF56_004801 [Candida oxycetoniae]KAI3402393.2 hypothetical protein KGF56_004801 [Candida oxycetoniae]
MSLALDKTHCSSSTPTIVTRTKSRNGCLTCKKKRLKCDETKPACINCTKKNIRCGGYATNFKWKSFKETKSLINEKSLNRHLELASLSVTGKSITKISKESELISRGLNPESAQEEDDDEEEEEVDSNNNNAALFTSSSSSSLSSAKRYSLPQRESPSRSGSDVTNPLLKPYSKTFSFSDFSSVKSKYENNNNNNDNISSADMAVVDIGGKQTSESSPLVLTKASPSSLSPEPLSMTKKTTKDPDFDVFGTPLLSAILSFANNPEEVDVSSVELLTPQALDRAQVAWAAASPDSDSVRSLAKSSEQDQILFLYCEHTSGIMSIKNGTHENPWRNMIVPLARKYNCLFNSIASMTLFHLAGRRELASAPEELRPRASNYMKRCILELASGLSKIESGDDCELPADIALATCLNLAFSEVWGTHTSSGIAHLKGAKSIIDKILALLKECQAEIWEERQKQSPIIRYSPNKKASKIGIELILFDQLEYEKMVHDSLRNESCVIIPQSIRFLLNAWIYLEVLARVTADANHDDKGIDLVATITTMLNKDQRNEKQQVDSSSSSSVQSDSTESFPSFFDVFDSFQYNTDSIDPLLGCGQGLFSIIGKVANLVAKIRKTKTRENWKRRNSLNTITQASVLRQALLDWVPSIDSSAVDQEAGGNGLKKTWDLASCIATAEAYRNSALLFLHQGVPELPSLPSHVLAEKILVLLSSIPVSSNLGIVHIFPLLVASCEAEPGEERDWCTARWKVLAEKMALGSIDRGVEVVKEVWKRKDQQSRDKTKHFYQYHNPLKNLMFIMNSGGDQPNKVDEGGIESRTHWTNVMKEWGWEVLLG